MTPFRQPFGCIPEWIPILLQHLKPAGLCTCFNTCHQKLHFCCKKFQETYCHHLLSVPKKKNPYTNLFQPTRPSPLLITKDAVASMKAGSVIVDLVPQSLSQTFFWGHLESSYAAVVSFCVFFFQGHKWMQELYSTVYIYIFLFLAGGKMKEESEKSVK